MATVNAEVPFWIWTWMLCCNDESEDKKKTHKIKETKKKRQLAIVNESEDNMKATRSSHSKPKEMDPWCYTHIVVVLWIMSHTKDQWQAKTHVINWFVCSGCHPHLVVIFVVRTLHYRTVENGLTLLDVLSSDIQITSVPKALDESELMMSLCYNVKLIFLTSWYDLRVFKSYLPTNSIS